jgi:DNA replication protein DnaC
MSLAIVKNRMLELGFQGMLPALEGVIERLHKGDLHITEALDTLFEHEWRYRSERATTTRKQRSKIRRGASLEEFDLTFSRGLTKADLRDLAKLEWCNEGKPLILIGATGVGKSFLARSLGLLACEHGKTALFLAITDFLENLAAARATNSYLKFRTSLVRPDVLILDDWGMRKFNAQEAEDLRDIVEHRSYGKSTIITTQLPIDHWGEVVGDEVILDALVDRLEPAGRIITFKGPSYRPRLSQKDREKKPPQE